MTDKPSTKEVKAPPLPVVVLLQRHKERMDSMNIAMSTADAYQDNTNIYRAREKAARKDVRLLADALKKLGHKFEA